jgi:glycosyltransferase involved in cell wall biosynthesis
VKINLVSRDNGVGLSQDMALLESVFRPAGHDVQRVAWDARSMRPADLAIWLELFNPSLARYSPRHIGIFNLEWFPTRWRNHLPRFKQLWAKSLECYEVMRRWGLRNVHHTGFLGRDLHDPAVPRERSVLHLAGHSPMKNTDAVIAAWRAHPDLPPLTIVSARERDVPAHVTLHVGRLADSELAHLMNACAIHLCPSAAEGWGHYITEALSVGALTITTDASPMNEQVRPEHGLLITPSATGRHHYAAQHHISPDAVADAVRRAAALPDAELARMGTAAREHLLARNERFRITALDLIRRA